MHKMKRGNFIIMIKYFLYNIIQILHVERNIKKIIIPNLFSKFALTTTNK